MVEELDDDLQDLLNELDERDGFFDESEAEEFVSEEQTKTEQQKLVPSDIALKPAEDIRRYDDSGQVSDMEPVSELPAFFEKYVEKLNFVTEEVLRSCRSDREEAQDTIDLCRQAIGNAKNKPDRMWVDGLVKAIEVKAGINGTAVKMMEANVKLLATTKAGIQINQRFGGTDLEALLGDSLDEDEY